jgi:hypothetical protein
MNTLAILGLVLFAAGNLGIGAAFCRLVYKLGYKRGYDDATSCLERVKMGFE